MCLCVMHECPKQGPIINFKNKVDEVEGGRQCPKRRNFHYQYCTVAPNRDCDHCIQFHVLLDVYSRIFVLLSTVLHKVMDGGLVIGHYKRLVLSGSQRQAFSVDLFRHGRCCSISLILASIFVVFVKNLICCRWSSLSGLKASGYAKTTSMVALICSFDVFGQLVLAFVRVLSHFMS